MSAYRRGVEVIKHIVVDAGIDGAAALPRPGGKFQRVSAAAANGDDGKELSGRRERGRKERSKQRAGGRKKGVSIMDAGTRGSRSPHRPSRIQSFASLSFYPKSLQS